VQEAQVELVIQAHLRLLLEQILAMAAVVVLAYIKQVLQQQVVQVVLEFQVAVAVQQTQQVQHLTLLVAQVVKV
jgi:hypothetical protein